MERGLEGGGLVAVNGDGGVSEAAEELVEFAFGFAAVEGGGGDFVAVEVEDGEDAAVGTVIAQEFDEIERGQGGGGF